MYALTFIYKLPCEKEMIGIIAVLETLQKSALGSTFNASVNAYCLTHISNKQDALNLLLFQTQ